ncbi:MAG: ATP-binding protein [Candidatus Bathyarchaeia archaeon]|nr:adenine nucleotide alpha hydrolase family protein [Candidatus Bathyarchaeota archaeon]
MPLCYNCRIRVSDVYLAYSRRYLCSECFKNHFERKVKSTIAKYRMIRRGERIGVAVSGGKDSTSLLYALRRLYPSLDMIAIHIDLGIEGYSEHCHRIVREFTHRLGTPLVDYSLEEEGYTLHDLQGTGRGRKMCSPCGVVKRHLLNRLALEAGVDRLATGHNLDDMVEVILNCYIHGDVDQLRRIHPVLPGGHPRLAARIKPLCELTEEEDLLYALYSELPFRSASCPLAEGARSIKGKRLIAAITGEIPQFKHLLFKSYLKRIHPNLKPLEGEIRECRICGFPTSLQVCAFCRITQLARGQRLRLGGMGPTAEGDQGLPG